MTTVRRGRDDAPRAFLAPSLTGLAGSLEVLAAVGGAVEQLLAPDVDEREDMLIDAETRDVTQSLKEPSLSLAEAYRSTPPLHRTDRHQCRYSIDFSLCTQYPSTGIERDGSLPIGFAQIGASVVAQEDRGKARPMGPPSGHDPAPPFEDGDTPPQILAARRRRVTRLSRGG